MKQQFNLKEYTKKDIEDAIETIQDGMRFNCEQMKANMNKPNFSELNVDLYMRNLKLEKDLNKFQREKSRRIRHSNW